MAIGNSNISMYSLAGELTNSLSDIGLQALFALSDTISNSDSGNFHNLNMTLNNSTNFSNAIYVPYSIGSNLVLSNWAYYDHDVEWEVSFSLVNNARDDVYVELWFGDGNSSFADIFFATTLGPLSTNTQTSFLTGIPSYSTGYVSYSGSYFILMLAVPNNPNEPRIMDVASANDTDGTGSGTNRTTYTSVNGTWDFASNGNFSDWIVAGDNSSQGISWNKRTTFQVDFNP